ncbi:MAG: DUF3429 domain-containing protein [Pseudomonadota bacterium]
MTTDAASAYTPPIPKPARVLGLAGVIPFAAGALAVWVAPAEYQFAAFTAQTLYAAVILSFLGGVQWGFAAAGLGPGAGPSWERLGWSVLPSLLGWAALFLDPTAKVAVLMLGFLAAFMIDRRWTQLGRCPPWYARLRRDLTALVTLSLGVSLMATFIYAA